MNSKLKLLMVPNSLCTFRGGERFVLEIASRLKGKFEITIANPISKADSKNITMAGIRRLYDLENVNVIDIPCIGRTTKVFGSEPYVMRTPTPGGALRLTKLVNGSDMVYEISLNPVILASVVTASKLFGKKLILGVHNFAVYGSLTSKMGWQSAAFNSTISKIRYFHVISRRDSEIVSKRLGAKAYFIPNPVFRSRSGVRNNTKSFECIFVGRFDRSQKGIDLLCKIVEDVLSSNNRIVFNIVGDGGDGLEMIKQLAKRHPSNVKLSGFLTGKRLDRAYDSASLMVLTSRLETMPMVLLDALSHGLPAVAFDIAGPDTMINSNGNGALVKRFDTGAFSDRILSYYSAWTDRKSYLKVKKKITSDTYKRYGADKIVREMSTMFSEVAAS